VAPANETGSILKLVNADELYLKHILLGIVLRPDLMRLARSEDERGILFRIHLAKSDMPLLIGKAGQTIATVRHIMKVYGKDGPTISVILEEPVDTRYGGGSGGGTILKDPN
jgi:predicted RNA-binding protein YlqC (UPF0109 family)